MNGDENMLNGLIGAQESARLMGELQAADQQAERLARGLNRKQLNWRPKPGAWSIGQCLEHLLIANEIYLPAISSSLDGRQPSPVPEVSLSRFSRWFIRNYIAPIALLRVRGLRRPRRSGLPEMLKRQSLTRFVAATTWRAS